MLTVGRAATMCYEHTLRRRVCASSSARPIPVTERGRIYGSPGDGSDFSASLIRTFWCPMPGVV
ncbi:hypothetical protein GCM10009780_76580 [Actinomadura alba]